MEIVSDDAVFQAALEFVDAFESNATAQRDTAARSDARGGHTVSTNAKRMRSELISLRAEVTKLEHYLTVLKRSQTRLGSTSANASTSKAMASYAWEALAVRQRKRRQTAEVENTQLRTMLEQQIRTARRLEKLLRKSCGDQFEVPRPVVGTHGRFLLDYNGLTAHVHAMQRHLQTLFRAPQVALLMNRAEPMQDLVERTDPAYGRVIEMTESRVFPVDFRVLSDALWYHVVKTPTRVVCVEDSGVDDTAIQREATFQLAPTGKYSHPGIIHSKTIGRRVQHDTADVFVWAMELNGGDRQSSTILRFWMFVRPGSDDPASPVSIVQSYMVSTPIDGHRATKRSRAKTVLDHFLDHRHAHMDEHWDQIDALLLDKS